jgi:hypothetical protein
MHYQKPKLLISLFTFLTVAFGLTLIPTSVSAQTNPFTPCQAGYAKLHGTGDCVPESEAEIPTTRCDNGTSVPEEEQGSIGDAYLYCKDNGAGGLDYSAPMAAGAAGSFGGDCKPGEGVALDRTNCGIVGYVVYFTRILSGIVGLVIVIMITVGGIQYAAAGPDPSAVVAARKRIINAVIALVLYIFMFSFLQWLVPGGIV